MASSSSTVCSTNAGVAAPTGGTVLATVTPNSAGNYRIRAQIGVGGGGAAVDANNVVLKVGSTTVGVVPHAQAAGLYPQGGPHTFQAYLDGATAVTLVTIATSAAAMGGWLACDLLGGVEPISFNE